MTFSYDETKAIVRVGRISETRADVDRISGFGIVDWSSKYF